MQGIGHTERLALAGTRAESSDLLNNDLPHMTGVTQKLG